jgi:phage gpG-like protein
MPTYTGKSLGSFGELGGEITFDWEPSLDDVAAELMEVAGYLENIEAPLALSKGVLQRDIQMRFNTKIDPDGNPWEPWSDSYAKYRERYYPEGGILVRTGDLESAATSEEAYEIGPEGIFYSTQGLPEYWLWNQEGRVRGGTSATAGMTQAEKEHMASALGTSVSELEGAQSGSNTLPARPFIGASFEAEIQIAEIFDKWFAGATSLATSSKGKLFGRHSYRGPGGQFAPRE